MNDLETAELEDETAELEDETAEPIWAEWTHRLRPRLEAACGKDDGWRSGGLWKDVRELMWSRYGDRELIRQVAETTLVWCRAAKQKGWPAGGDSINALLSDLVENRHTPADIIVDLYAEWHLVDAGEINIVRCEQIQTEHLQAIADRRGWDWKLATHPNCTAEQLQQMIDAEETRPSGPEDWVVAAVVRHRNATPGQIRWAYWGHSSPSMRAAAAAHPNCPKEVKVAYATGASAGDLEALGWGEEEWALAAQLADGRKWALDELDAVVTS